MIFTVHTSVYIIFMYNRPTFKNIFLKSNRILCLLVDLLIKTYVLLNCCSQINKCIKGKKLVLLLWFSTEFKKFKLA